MGVLPLAMQDMKNCYNFSKMENPYDCSLFWDVYDRMRSKGYKPSFKYGFKGQQAAVANPKALRVTNKELLQRELEAVLKSTQSVSAKMSEMIALVKVYHILDDFREWLATDIKLAETLGIAITLNSPAQWLSKNSVARATLEAYLNENKMVEGINFDINVFGTDAMGLTVVQ